MFEEYGRKGGNRMTRGTPFEVSKEVFERAKAQSINKDAKSFYMAKEDEERIFSDSIRWGYGLYDCKVHEEDGKYICTWSRGDTCD